MESKFQIPAAATHTAVAAAKERFDRLQPRIAANTERIRQAESEYQASANTSVSQMREAQALAVLDDPTADVGSHGLEVLRESVETARRDRAVLQRANDLAREELGRAETVASVEEARNQRGVLARLYSEAVDSAKSLQTALAEIDEFWGEFTAAGYRESQLPSDDRRPLADRVETWITQVASSGVLVSKK